MSIKDLRKELQAKSIYEEIIQDSEASSMINIATYSQPVCTAIQIALIGLLHEWEIYPQRVLGHSSGNSDHVHYFLSLTLLSKGR